MKSTLFISRNFNVDMGRPVGSVELRVYVPRRRGAGGYDCLYEIVVMDTVRRSSKTVGEDSFQAFFLALSLAAMELQMEVEKIGGRLDRNETRELRAIVARFGK